MRKWIHAQGHEEYLWPQMLPIRAECKSSTKRTEETPALHRYTL